MRSRVSLGTPYPPLSIAAATVFPFSTEVVWLGTIATDLEVYTIKSSIVNVVTPPALFQLSNPIT